MRLVFAISLLALVAVAQPITTSDSRRTHGRQWEPPIPPPLGVTNTWPERAVIYIAPHIDVFPLVITNVRPLVVEVTVTTQVVQRTVWHDNGPHTNDLILCSNLVSRTTNSL